MKITNFIFLFLSLLVYSNSHTQILYSNEKKSIKEVALTYDDGPSYITPELCDLLKKYNVKATFFVLGENVKKYPQYLKRIKEDGHLIGSHTYSHINFYRLKKNPEIEKIIKDEIKKTEEEIIKVTGEKPVFLRFPYGYSDKKGIKIANELGYKVYNWSFGYDWNNISDEDLIKRYIANIKPGSIFLMHEGYKKTDRVLKLTEALIQELTKRGYKIVRLDEMSFK